MDTPSLKKQNKRSSEMFGKTVYYFGDNASKMCT